MNPQVIKLVVSGAILIVCLIGHIMGKDGLLEKIALLTVGVIVGSTI